MLFSEVDRIVNHLFANFGGAYGNTYTVLFIFNYLLYRTVSSRWENILNISRWSSFQPYIIAFSSYSFVFLCFGFRVSVFSFFVLCFEFKVISIDLITFV